MNNKCQLELGTDAEGNEPSCKCSCACKQKITLDVYGNGICSPCTYGYCIDENGNDL